MNTAERVIEAYYRYVKRCFTIPDVKVVEGKNRQLDLLAVNLATSEQYHVECSVSHRLGWAPKVSELKAIFGKKFLGLSPKREGKRTDYKRGINYGERISKTYEHYGLDPRKIQRVFVCWVPHSETETKAFLDKFKELNQIGVQILRFRDEVLPKLLEVIGTSNYDDDALRLIGFLKERDKQVLKMTKPIPVEDIKATASALTIVMKDRRIKIPWNRCSPRIARATAEQQRFVELSPSGYGIHWPLLDEDLSVRGLLARTIPEK